MRPGAPSCFGCVFEVLSVRGVVLVVPVWAVFSCAGGFAPPLPLPCSLVAPPFVCLVLCSGVVVRVGALVRLAVVLPPAVFAPLAFAAPLPVAPLYGAAALAGTTPAPLKFPGLAVAATAGFPWFTEAN